jgi:hypothetical protein
MNQTHVSGLGGADLRSRCPLEASTLPVTTKSGYAGLKVFKQSGSLGDIKAVKNVISNP